MKAIQKKYYTISPSGKGTIAVDTPLTSTSTESTIQKIILEGFDLVYERWFKFRKCSSIEKITNFYSVFDFIITSGTSTGDKQVLVEYKDRSISVDKYKTTMIDKSKLVNLKKACELLDANCLLVIEYFDAVVYWWLTEDFTDYVDGTIKDTDNPEYLKDVVHLDISKGVVIEKPWYKITSNPTL